MGGYKPPFTLTNEILSYVYFISEKIGRKGVKHCLFGVSQETVLLVVILKSANQLNGWILCRYRKSPFRYLRKELFFQ